MGKADQSKLTKQKKRYNLVSLHLVAGRASLSNLEKDLKAVYKYYMFTKNHGVEV